MSFFDSCKGTYTCTAPSTVKPLSLDELCRVMDELKKSPPPASSLKIGYSLYTRCFTHLPKGEPGILPSFSGLPFKLDYGLEPCEFEPVYTPENELRMIGFMADALL